MNLGNFTRKSVDAIQEAQNIAIDLDRNARGNHPGLYRFLQFSLHLQDGLIAVADRRA